LEAASKGGQRNAQVVVGCGIIRRQCQGSAECVEGFIKLLRLVVVNSAISEIKERFSKRSLLSGADVNGRIYQ
jgi:hypothetical protein